MASRLYLSPHAQKPPLHKNRPFHRAFCLWEVLGRGFYLPVGAKPSMNTGIFVKRGGFIAFGEKAIYRTTVTRRPRSAAEPC